MHVSDIKSPQLDEEEESDTCEVTADADVDNLAIASHNTLNEECDGSSDKEDDPVADEPCRRKG